MMLIGGLLLGTILLILLFIVRDWAPELKREVVEPRWATAPSAFINVTGIRVHVRDEGPRDDSSPIVLLHGTASSLHTWDGWTELLKGDRRVVRFDLPGFGLTSPSPDGTYGAEKDTSLLVAILDFLDIDQCVLGGNSLGGSISWRTALTHPSRVEKLILVDAGGYDISPGSRPVAFYFAKMSMIDWIVRNTLPRGLIDWMVRNTLPRGIVAQGLRKVYGDPSKVGVELIARYRELIQMEGNRRAFIKRVGQWLRAPRPYHRIPELQMPTLIIWGGRDRLVPPEAAELFHRDIAGSTLVMFDDLGHLPQEEDPVRTVAAVRKFLQLKPVAPIA